MKLKNRDDKSMNNFWVNYRLFPICIHLILIRRTTKKLPKTCQYIEEIHISEKTDVLIDWIFSHSSPRFQRGINVNYTIWLQKFTTNWLKLIKETLTPHRDKKKRKREVAVNNKPPGPYFVWSLFTYLFTGMIFVELRKP